MKNVVSIIKVLAIVSSTLILLAACATEQFGLASADAGARLTTEAIKAASGEIVIGTIRSIDTKATTINVKGQTIKVKPEDIANLKVGNRVKVTLTTGTMNAEEIVQIGKEELKQQAIQKAIDKAVETQTQQAPGN